MAAIAEIIAYTSKSTKKWSRIFYIESVYATNNEGIRNPTAVPIILTTVNPAIASDLLLN
jgi:hypothetical protein